MSAAIIFDLVLTWLPVLVFVAVVVAVAAVLVLVVRAGRRAR